ncbi:MAG: DUF4386 domain-containing protein [Acidimicrobiales bacterium]
MSYPVRTTATRKTALVAGVLYLITFISIPSLALYNGVLHNRLFIIHAGGDAGVLLGAFLEVVVALAGVGTAITLFPVVKRHNQTAARGFAAARVVEGAMILAGVVSLVAVVALRQPVASGAHAASLVHTGRTLVAIHNWTFRYGQGLIPAVNALCLGSVLYRYRLVPRIIPALGLVGAPFLVASVVAMASGLVSQVSVVSGIATLPIAAWEFSLGIWLVVKGFTISPSTSTDFAAPVRDRQGQLASALA